ncbi:hypothetical protein [Cupriavidus lacunae]|uniref:hypothetical protein n=1 Tax=Cupriavidus lacunae TaxID=2666307 RepID=UPI001ABF0280|nr:hypothetical protein [Cupriavidus lacunae]
MQTRWEAACSGNSRQLQSGRTLCWLLYKTELREVIDKVFRLDTLALGWAQVEKNAGAAGVDRMSVKRFAQARDRYLAELAHALQDGSYRPQPVRRVYIPKGKGRRPLGIPAVKDRVVQAAEPVRFLVC